METVITRLENNKNNIYIKRDDLIPFSFGGNKARKAFKFFEEIDKGDYDCVVTYGSSSSNHCRIVSNMAVARNLPCYIIGPTEASTPTNNSAMMEVFEAEINIVPVENVRETIETTVKNLEKSGKKPYFIQGGGHGNLGTQAYVECYDEICKYESSTGIHFDYIFFASGTGTTQAGLVCGQLIKNDKKRIVGISIARKNPYGREVVLNSIKDYLKEQNLIISDNIISDATVFIDDYVGEGYGKENKKIQDTIFEVLRRYGIPLDSTYTGKAFWGMLDFLEKESVLNKNILFIHTGGTPLFFDDILKK